MTKSDIPSDIDINLVKRQLEGSDFDQHLYKTRYKDMIIQTTVTQRRNLPQSAHVEFSVNGSINNVLDKNNAVDAARVLNIVSSHLKNHVSNNRTVEGYTYTTTDDTKDRLYIKMGKINSFPVKKILPDNNMRKILKK
jgi:hypothetical protein